MKNFHEILQQNGIKIPKKSNSIIGWIFHKRWDHVEKAYGELQKQYAIEKRIWQECQIQIEEDWGIIDMPPLESGRDLTFRTPRQAIELISSEEKRINNGRVPLHYKRKIIQSKRVEWIQGVIAGAPEDCSLIVIKDINYVPSQDDLDRFEESVRVRKECSIQSLMLKVWIAFSPNSDIKIEFWAIQPKRCTIDYI